MKKIATLNKIATCGLQEFPESYEFIDNYSREDAILVRSASLHDLAFDSATLAIARAGAGVNNIPIESCTEQGIVVFNTPGANANAVKELVLAGLFLVSRNIAGGIEWCKTLKNEGESVGKIVEQGKSSFAGPEIFGKTLAVLGLGAIGRLVANAAVALGMKVLGVDPYLTETQRAQLDPAVEISQNLSEILSKSDYLTLHIPLTQSTKEFVDAEFLSKCKEHVRILNFSRAELVRSEAVLAALEREKVAAYVTDFPVSELIDVPGVIAIPHLGASTPESEDNCAIMAAQQLTAFLERGEILNSVNFPSTALPKEFVTRVIVIHSGEAETVLSALGSAVFSECYACGDVSYTVADFDSDVSIKEISDLPQIVRIRKLQQG